MVPLILHPHLLTCAVAVIILGPPLAPATATTRSLPDLPAVSVTMVGAMDDKGLFPGLMKLASEGGRP